MISLQHSLTPTLAALLLKELPREDVSEFVSAPLDAPAEQEAIERFYNGLEEHRLDLRSDAGAVEFYRAILIYLEALLDPQAITNRSGIEITASCATNTWGKMNDAQKTSLWKEAAAIYPQVLSALTTHGWLFKN